MSRLNEGAMGRRFPLPSMLQKLACALAVALALLCAGTAAPSTAQALETAKITARPNTGSGSETRITWEVQADADEELSGLSLTFVDGTTFGTDDTRLTMLSGEDLMDRTPMKPTCKADGQTLKIDFGETAPAGGFFRVEVYGVTFPVEGGDEAFGGTYTLADGSTKKISKIPSVEIKGVTAFDNFLTDLKEQPWVEAWNSNMFLRLFLNPVILVQSLPIVFKGFLMSLSIVLVAFPLAIPFGFALSLMRISKSRILRCLAGIYVNIIRGTPAFLQIYIAFFGLPLAGVKVDDYVLGVIVMAMNSSAYLCEIFRAGILAVDKGQTEAARSLGLSEGQTMVKIILPQAVRNILPALGNEFIMMLKETSLASTFFLGDIMTSYLVVKGVSYLTLEPLTIVAIIYLCVTYPLSKIVDRFGKKMANPNSHRTHKEKKEGTV